MTTLKSDVIALLVHDLKNPLAALLSNLGFVASMVKEDEMTAEAVQDCLLSTEVLGRLIENIGVMGSLDGSQTRSSGASVPEVLASVERRMERHAETAMFHVESECEPGLPTVSGSSKLLELALDNLVSTSMSYAPPSSTIRVVARGGGAGSVIISVLDQGAPVAEELRPLLDDRDHQVELKSAKGGRYGRALGVHVASLIAKNAGGELRIGEAEGGSAFELVLPVER